MLNQQMLSSTFGYWFLQSPEFTLENSRTTPSTKFHTTWFELSLLVNPVKIPTTTDLAYNIHWEKQNATMQKKV